MVRSTARQVICLLILFMTGIDISPGGMAFASEFEIDEIITAIKNEINTANIPELGSPNFSIDTVSVVLAVDSTETEKGAIAVRIVGLSSEVEYGRSTAKSYHKLSFSFQPSDSSGFSPEISLGLVEPIKRVKSSLKKAYNTPPGFHMEGFTLKLEFAIQQQMDGTIRFRILDLEDLKSRNIATHNIKLHIKITK